MSIQTDTSDLIGGYKPIDTDALGIRLFNKFSELYRETFITSKKGAATSNKDFLVFVQKAVLQKQWKKVIKGFHLAHMKALEKLKKMSEHNMDPCLDNQSSWEDFMIDAKSFENSFLNNINSA